MKAVSPFALLLGALLAGCSDAGSDAPPSGTGDAMTHHGSMPAGTHLLAPNATLGDYWTWTSPQVDGPYTSVIAAEQGDDWVMATDHPDIAFFDARSDIASLGAVRKSDLAGSQGSTRVQFFDFPLTANKTWSTTWDEDPMSLRVLEVSGGVADIEARRADGTLYAAYTYDDAKGYFGEIAYYDDTGTTVGFEAKITASGRGFSGDLIRWTYETVFEQSGPIGGPGFAQNFPVPLTATDVYAELAVECTSGTFIAGVAPLPVVTTAAGVDDRGTGTTSGACPLSMADFGPVGEPRQTVPESTEEQWGFSAFADATAAGTFTLNIYVRTQELFQVDSA